MVALEETFQTRLDEKAFAGAHDVGQLRALVEEASKGAAEPPEAVQLTVWNRSLASRLVRRVALPGFIMPLVRTFAWRYMGEFVDSGHSVLIFPEGHRSHTGEIDRIRPGIGMIASRLDVPVVPVRLEARTACSIARGTWRDLGTCV
jgi:hypothetical protein